MGVSPGCPLLIEIELAVGVAVVGDVRLEAVEGQEEPEIGAAATLNLQLVHSAGLKGRNDIGFRLH